MRLSLETGSDICGQDRLPARAMRVEFLDVQQHGHRWPQVLKNFNYDLHHLEPYLRCESERMRGQGVGAWVHDGVDSLFVPLVVRKLPFAQGGYDACSPYGYACPLFSTDRIEFRARAMRALIDACRDQKIVALFLRLHPLLGGGRDCLETFGSLVTHGQTVWIDLRTSEEEQWADIRPGTRNLIRRMKREAFIARIDRDCVSLDRFAELYQATLQRAGGVPLSTEYLHQLREQLGSHMFICTVEHRGESVASGLFSECNGIVQYHLSGDSRRYRRESPPRLMLDRVRRWAMLRGNHTLYLGGGVEGKADSLFAFKSRFSSRRAPLQTLRIVCDQKAYKECLDRWSRTHRRQPDSIEGFFPAYRKAL